jgi:cytochrome c
MTAGRLGVWIAAGMAVLLAAGLGVLRFRLLDVGSGAALAAGDPAQGEKVFNKCKVCHSADQPKNKVGPLLVGIIGRPAASIDDYSYSEAMKDSGIVWDEATLDKYLADPEAVVPHTKMAFVGLNSKEDRQNVIAYLKSLAK